MAYLGAWRPRWRLMTWDPVHKYAMMEKTTPDFFFFFRCLSGARQRTSVGSVTCDFVTISCFAEPVGVIQGVRAALTPSDPLGTRVDLSRVKHVRDGERKCDVRVTTNCSSGEGGGERKQEF